MEALLPPPGQVTLTNTGMRRVRWAVRRIFSTTNTCAIVHPTCTSWDGSNMSKYIIPDPPEPTLWWATPILGVGFSQLY